MSAKPNRIDAATGLPAHCIERADSIDDASPHVLVQTYQHRFGNCYAELWQCNGDMPA